MNDHVQAYAEVAAVLQVYFDGLHHSDTDRLSRVFHPRRFTQQPVQTCH